MQERTFLRRATVSDYRAFYKKEPLDDGWVGFVAERSGAIVAFGFVYIDHAGRAWTGVDGARAVPPLLLHRAIRNFFLNLRAEGIPMLYALCDERIEASGRWLSRLGFAVDDTLAKVYMPEVDKFAPVWKRPL